MKKEELYPCYYENLEDGTGGYFKGRHCFNFNGVCGNCGQYCEEEDKILTNKYEKRNKRKDNRDIK